MSGWKTSSPPAAPASRGCAMPPEEAAGGLRLRAEDADDLAVISACLQDALVPVGDIHYRGFRRGARERILPLLAIRPEARPGREGGMIHLDFSGGAGIRLEVDRILCRVKDVGLPWPTPWRPRHDPGGRR